MWINRKYFESIVANCELHLRNVMSLGSENVSLRTRAQELTAQKAKDDITIDWMRHRINALEKERAVLVQKAAGISLPVPEIVPTRPGTMSAPPSFDSMPTFDDVGDAEAARLGLRHDDHGFLEDMKTATGTTHA